MTRFRQAEIPPHMLKGSEWRYLFLTVDDPPNDTWKHDPDSAEFWLRAAYTWCEERYGNHYGAGMYRFWFAGQNRVLFRDETDAIDFKLRWC